MNKLIPSLIITLILGIVGCSSLPTAPVVSLYPEQTWSQQLPLLMAQHAWHLEGAVSVISPQGSQVANIDWLQFDDNSYRIQLYGPLGLGTVKLVSQSQEVDLTLSDGRHYQALNAAQLMQQILGWSLPVEGLVYWVRGIPDPAFPAQIQLNSVGVLSTLVQQGWTIQYLSDQQIGELIVPHQLRLTNGQLKVMMAVRWQR